MVIKLDFRQVAYYIAEPKANKKCAIYTLNGETIYCDFIQLDKDINTILRGYNKKGTIADLIFIMSIDCICDIRLLDKNESEAKITIDLSEKEITAIMASHFVLRKSREIKYDGEYVENIRDYQNSRKISFSEANEILFELLDKIITLKYNKGV